MEVDVKLEEKTRITLEIKGKERNRGRMHGGKEQRFEIVLDGFNFGKLKRYFMADKISFEEFKCFNMFTFADIEFSRKLLF